MIRETDIYLATAVLVALLSALYYAQTHGEDPCARVSCPAGAVPVRTSAAPRCFCAVEPLP